MFCFGVSGREILLVVAVFCFAWQRRMSLGQGGVESDGGEVPSNQTEVKSRWGREKRKLESESGCTLMIKKGNGVDRVRRALFRRLASQ